MAWPVRAVDRNLPWTNRAVPVDNAASAVGGNGGFGGPDRGDPGTGPTPLWTRSRARANPSTFAPRPIPETVGPVHSSRPVANSPTPHAGA